MNRSDDDIADDVFDGLKVVAYGRGRDGSLGPASASSWQPLNAANHQAWQEIHRNIEASAALVRSGRVSSIHYHMTCNLMDPGLVAAYTGLFRWQVRLHLHPWVFRRLSRRTLDRYCRLFNVSLQDLKAGVMPAPSGPGAVDHD